MLRQTESIVKFPDDKYFSNQGKKLITIFL
jgi:hypothetical protein